MQVPIVNGVYIGTTPDIRKAYPINMIPWVEPTDVSGGYLKTSFGISSVVEGSGKDRGGTVWNGVCYRVMGDQLVKLNSDETITELGFVSTDADYSQARLVNGFDELAICSNERLYIWDEDAETLTQVTDGDLGTSLDVIWIDGYYMSTDGEYLVITELGDPTSVNPLKYGSSEVDPDPIVGLIKLRNEAWALNRYSIEIFQNVGGSGFPFERVTGAQIQKGVLGRRCFCEISEVLAFLGSGHNEQPGIYLAEHSTTTKVSTREIDLLLTSYTEEQLALVELESIERDGHIWLMVHLPDRTAIFDLAASKALGEQVWFYMTSATTGFSQWRARHFTWVYDNWYVADPTTSYIGKLDSSVNTQWGAKNYWEFNTGIAYNKGAGAIVLEMELVAVAGRYNSSTANPTIATQYSTNGLIWSQNKYIGAGRLGSYNQRLVWRNNGMFRNYRIQKFHGDSDSNLAFPRLEVKFEPLAW